MSAPGATPVETAGRVGLAIRRGNGGVSGEDGWEERANRRGGSGVLLNALGVGEEEELVLNYGAADRAAELVALEGRVHGVLGTGEAGAVVLEVIEERTVDGVGAAAGGDEDLAGGSDVTGDVLCGTVELELVDGALRDVEDCRADGLVGDVLTIEKNSGGTAGDAGDGDGRVAGLGGIEALTGLEDDTGLDLREVEEVAAVHREAANLLAGDDVRDAGLVGVDLNGAGVDLDGLALAADGELEAAGGRGTGADDGLLLILLEAGGRDRDRV